MDVLYDLISRTEKLTDQFIGRSMFSRDDVKKFIIELNTMGQLFDLGVDSLGNQLPLYSETTEILTNGLKRAGTPFTLKNTGEFYDSFIIVPDNNGNAEIQANTLKADVDQIVDLLDIATPYILGLTKESNEKLSAFLVSIIQEIVRKTLVGS